MRKFRLLYLNPVVLLTLCLACTTSRAQEKQALRLVQTIPMPNVKGRIDQILLDNTARRILVAVWELGRNDVFEAKDRQVILSWTTGGQSGDMALDQAHHRLFVATRTAPQMMLVYDPESGPEIARLPAEGRMNGVYYDGWHKRINVTCGRELPAGFVFVFQQKAPDHYEPIGAIQVGAHGKTSLLVPELNRYYVAGSEHQDVIRGIQGGKFEEA